jgi:hypothetical protein
MNKKRKAFKSTKLLSLLLIECSFIFGINNTILAENKSNSSNKQKSITFVPPGDLKPKNSVGGASRSSTCNSEANSMVCLTPLIPSNNIGLTIESHPSFLVYIPEHSKAEMGYFSIRNSNDDYYYRTKISLNNKSGIVKITLPKDASDLKIGQDYKWSLAMMSGKLLKPDTPFIQGYVKRVDPEAQLQEQLSSANSLEKASLYGQAGLWYETVATLANLREKSPKDANLQTQWQELLSSVGLEKVATKSFAE